LGFLLTHHSLNAQLNHRQKSLNASISTTFFSLSSKSNQTGENHTKGLDETRIEAQARIGRETKVDGS
jgi:hypothetical protein